MRRHYLNSNAKMKEAFQIGKKDGLAGTRSHYPFDLSIDGDWQECLWKRYQAGYAAAVRKEAKKMVQIEIDFDKKI